MPVTPINKRLACRLIWARRLIWPAALWLIVTALSLPSVMTAVSGIGFDADLRGLVHQAAATLSWLFAAWFGARLFWLLVQSEQRPVPRLLGDIVTLLLFGAAILIALGSVFGQPIAALVTTSGVVVAVLGFSLRELIADIFAGVCINLERPYTIGDWLDLAPYNQVGRVVEINWRATRLVTIDGITVVVPNGLMARSRFLNFSTPKRSFRVQVPVVLTHEVPVERIERLLLAAIAGTANVLDEPQPDVVVDAYTDHGVRYLARFWVADYAPMTVTRGHVAANIHRHLRLGGVPLQHGRQDLVLARASLPPSDLDGRRVEVLSQLSLFRVLPLDDLTGLCHDLSIRHVVPGAVVVAAGAAGRSLFVVVEGLLEVLGEAGVLATLIPGEVFGEMSLLTGAPRSATVVAASEAILFEIFDHQLRPILQRRPELAEALGVILDQRQRANQQRQNGDGSLDPNPAPHQPLLDRIREFFGLVR